MNYTREPIIETVITPKEGYKLIVRNSKRNDQEEYAVDAIEVVSFGHSFFFRSLERPKPFLVPVSDYEVIETKETRVVLKNASFDRSIKIGGGREAPSKPKEKPVQPIEEQEPAAVEQRLEKKRERRRHRRRRVPLEKETEEVKQSQPEHSEGGGVDDETQVSSSKLSRLIPPPAQLIAEKISKEKSQPSEETQGDVLPEPVEEKPKEKPKKARRKKKGETPSAEKKEDIPPDTEREEMQKIAASESETATSHSFGTVEEKGKFSFFGKIW